MTSTTMTRLMQRLQQMPRAARWGVYGVSGLLILYAYSNLVLPTAASWSAKADKIQTALDISGNEAAIKRRISEIAPVIAAVGQVEDPRNEATASEALNTAVNDILKRHVISKQNFQTASPVKLPQSALRGIVGPNEQAEHLDARLEFESTAEEAAAIVAELEDAPAIEKISSLRMAKLGGAGRKLSVKLTLESWMISRAASPVVPGGAGVRR